MSNWPDSDKGVLPPWVPHQPSSVRPPVGQSAPIGCICPPTANLSCQRPDCPRKPLPKT